MQVALEVVPLKLAAPAMRTSQSALGAYYRRLCGRMDQPKAVTAAEHKLARLIYAMLTNQGRGVHRSGPDNTTRKRYRERVIANLNRRASALGLQVVPAGTMAPA